MTHPRFIAFVSAAGCCGDAADAGGLLSGFAAVHQNNFELVIFCRHRHLAAAHRGRGGAGEDEEKGSMSRVGEWGLLQTQWRLA